MDVAAWGLDRPFTYLVPPNLEAGARFGALVRVPLRNRSVRGWIVGEASEVPPDCAAISKVSSALPVFDEALLAAARALAARYLHPLSSFLSLMTPPLLPHLTGDQEVAWPPKAARRAAGIPVLKRLCPGEDPVPLYVGVIAQSLKKDRGAIVVVPEVREGSAVVAALRDAFGQEATEVHSAQSTRDRSDSLWGAVTGRHRVVIGGRAAVMAPAFPLGVVIVHQEHHSSLKEERNPYYHAAVAAVVRARASGARCLATSASPSLQAAGLGSEWTLEEPTRAEERGSWPLVEILTPGRHAVPQRAAAAVLGAWRRNEKSLVLLPRNHPTSAGPGPAELVRYLERALPGASVTRADRPGLGAEPGLLAGALAGDVVVGTVAALAEVGRPRLGVVVALGADAYLEKPTGRGTEEAFELLWRAGSLLAGGPSKGRFLIETRDPGHHVVQGLTRGDYHYFATRELEVRRRAGLPPFVTLVRVHLAAGKSAALVAALEKVPGVEVLGPIEGRVGEELLLKVEDFTSAAPALREALARTGGGVLAEVDPKEW